VILLIPVGGAIFYFLFGINRIRRRAASLRRRRLPVEPGGVSEVCLPEELSRGLTPDFVHLAAVARVAESITGAPLLKDNRVSPLFNGEEAYPAMLEAIRGASGSVGLSSYIFERDEAGQKFIDALREAKSRGVEVRVLLDDAGSDRKAERALLAGSVAVSRFHPVIRLFPRRYLNLRNHRKILVVDGRTAFTGGMNLRQSHLVDTPQPHREQDVHFRIEGPVVEHIQRAFVDDWAFATGEVLQGAAWFPVFERRGPVYARGLPSDPGLMHDALRWVIVGALGCARSRVRIMTPYFLPDAGLIDALNVAALRGVQVDILVPEQNDNRVVKWASTAMLWQLLSSGCRVWETPRPFDHSKLIVVDGAWTLLGSANLDPRSLRLNFEFDVECYDRTLASGLEARIEEKLGRSREITLAMVDARPLGIRLRDGLARLFMPYL
jgi:cardiolipin synthase